MARSEEMTLDVLARQSAMMRGVRYTSPSANPGVLLVGTRVPTITMQNDSSSEWHQQLQQQQKGGRLTREVPQ
jgi:hypothetical protein